MGPALVLAGARRARWGGGGLYLARFNSCALATVSTCLLLYAETKRRVTSLTTLNRRCGMQSSDSRLARSGLAALSDLGTVEWRELFDSLQAEQHLFLQKENQFRSPEYKWPRDPLNNWSRRWEYPYVYHHLRQQVSRASSREPLAVLDIGSGVTFFPFALAKLGLHVTCVDTDTVAERDIKRAVGVVPHQPGRIDFVLADGAKLPFPDGTVDAVYCISVLEHVPDPSGVAVEVARVLKPGGLFVLTIDLDTSGLLELDPPGHARLYDTILEHFDYLCPERTVHPADVLGPYGSIASNRERLAWMCWYHLKQYVLKPIFGKTPVPIQYVAIQAFVLTRG